MSEQGTIEIAPLGPGDGPRVAAFMAEHWGDEMMVVHGVIHHPSRLPGFAALADGAWRGLVSYQIDGGQCEIVSLDSLDEGRGIGSALLAAVAGAARAAGCRRIWLVTTNDNLNALRFYQKRGFALVAVHRDAVAAARRIKPSIPLTGEHGIPIRDELELELALG
ncbi:MAG TPA: GNAT family N-acetyltransferase [Herpetosiphonaceae bacterium]